MIDDRRNSIGIVTVELLDSVEINWLFYSLEVHRKLPLINNVLYESSFEWYRHEEDVFDLLLDSKLFRKWKSFATPSDNFYYKEWYWWWLKYRAVVLFGNMLTYFSRGILVTLIEITLMLIYKVIQSRISVSFHGWIMNKDIFYSRKTWR
jgi:hypothetical protein